MGNRREERVNESSASAVFCTAFAMIVPGTGFSRNSGHSYYKNKSVHMLWPTLCCKGRYSNDAGLCLAE